MNRRKLCLVLATAFLGVMIAGGLAVAGKAAPQDQMTFPLYPGKKLGLAITGDPSAQHRVFIGFDRTPGPSEQGLVKGLGGKIRYSYHIVPAIAATVPEAAIDHLMKNPRVTYIEKVRKFYAIDQSVPWGIDKIRALEVHSEGNWGGDSTEGIKVAVIDTGIYCDHQDLVSNCKGGWDFVNNDDDPYDDNSHGTHVAGTIAALDNDIGVLGAAPLVEVYALKVMDASGSGTFDDVVAALQWCVGNGIEVTNNSYGDSVDPGDTVEAAFSGSYDGGNGILHIAAAGNSGTWFARGDNVLYPARWDSLVAVAATDSSDSRVYFSSTGPAVELAAPGYNIYSTLPGDQYGNKSGTSMASPHVAGAAALVMYENLGLSAGQVRTMLNGSAVDLGAAGRDTLYGWGRVDAAAAVLAAAVPEPTGTLSGTVIADGGGAIERATVAATDGSTTKSTTTDSNGSYSLTLPPGSYSVTASASGYVDSEVATATISEGKTTTLNFVLEPQPGGSIKGTVTDEGTSLPISGATVKIEGLAHSDITDDFGNYELSDVPAGTFTVSASATNYTTVEKSVTVTSNEATKADFTLSPASTTQPQMTVWAIDYATDDKGRHLFVTVSVVAKDESSTPVSGAAVSITLNGPKTSSSSGTTGSDGKVTFKYPNAPSGTYTTTVTSVTHSDYVWDESYPEEGTLENEFTKE